MDDLRFAVISGEVFIHTEDLKRGLQAKCLLVIRNAVQSGQASELIGDLFNTAFSSAIQAVDDITAKAIETLQSSQN